MGADRVSESARLQTSQSYCDSESLLKKKQRNAQQPPEHCTHNQHAYVPVYVKTKHSLVQISLYLPKTHFSHL